MPWTNEQQKAIINFGYNIIDSAGAGSGKTAVLSERVRYFIQVQGYHLSEFLLLTFTRLAAGEMKERIRKKLEEIESPEASFVDTCDITTFDSFANAIVKKYHYLLGVSKDVGVVDSNVISVKKRDYIDEIFTREYDAHNKDFEELIAKFCFKDDQEIRSLVLKIQEKGDLELDKEEFYSSFIEKHYSKEFVQRVEKEIVARIEAKRKLLYEAMNDLPAIPEKKGGEIYSEHMFSLFDDFLHASTYQELIAAMNLIEKVPSAPRGKNVEQEDKDSINIFRESFSDIKDYISSLPETKEELENSILDNKKYAELLLSFALELDRKQYAYKEEKQMFEFQDIAKMALKLVKENKEVREELKAKYKMIMIDEYQDTSALQEAFISLIANNNVYMVGDIKQSIYAFRNARSDIFASKYAAYKNHDGGEVIDMNKNFRSRKEVLEDINYIFSNIMTEDLGGADYKKYHVIEYGLTDYLKGDNPSQNNHAEFITYDDKAFNEKGIKKPEAEATIIAEDIIKKINEGYTVFKPGNDKKGIEPSKRPCEFKDFCILMDRGTTFDIYKKVFTEYQIPLFVEQDEDIKDNVIVKLLTNLLIVIKSIKEYSLDDDTKLAYVSLARSFIFEEKDEDIYLMCKNNSYFENKVYLKIKEIIDTNQGLANYDLLQKVIDGLDIYHKFVLIGNVEKNSLYLDTFSTYLAQMSDLNYTLDEFITYLHNIDDYGLKFTLSSTGSNINSVRIMNIHKSKGLEFPIVYFPGLTTKFNENDIKSPFGVSVEYGLLLPTDNDKKYIVKSLVDEKSLNDDLSEKIRLLYVSLTRTREKMIFVTPSENGVLARENAKSFDNLLRPLMNHFKNNIYVEQEESPRLPHRGWSGIELGFNDMEEVHFEFKEREISQVSKHLKLNTNKYLLEYGTYLHEVMEVTNFVNPDYSIIKNEKAKEIVQRFLANPLLENVKDAKAYKEYEFKTEKNNGIIDLFLVYEDHIDLIDYKTKNIQDDKYEIQINIYKEFLEKTFHKKVNGYLYSLLDGELKEVK